MQERQAGIAQRILKQLEDVLLEHDDTVRFERTRERDALGDVRRQYCVALSGHVVHGYRSKVNEVYAAFLQLAQPRRLRPWPARQCADIEHRFDDLAEQPIVGAEIVVVEEAPVLRISTVVGRALGDEEQANALRLPLRAAGCVPIIFGGHRARLRGVYLFAVSARIVAMGILQRLFGQRTPTPVDASVQPPADAREGNEALSRVRSRMDSAFVSDGEPELVKLTGTTTFAKDAITRLAERRGITELGYLEVSGSIQREPENAADTNAVAVHVDGERIGYLPGYVAARVELSAGGSRTVALQIFTQILPKGSRAEAWAWLPASAPQWQWSEKNRPPLSSEAKAAAHHAGVTEVVNDALADGGERAQSFELGMVSGVHYLQLVEPIKQLKREGRLDEALVLCNAAIEGAEGGREGREPAPWYTEQAAIIHRKLGQRDEEIAVLRRWLAVCPPDRRDGSRIKERLDKLTS